MADFRAVYGLHLPDCLDWSPRLLIALIEELPDDGALAASLQGGRDFRGWGRTRHMLADLWDLGAADLMRESKKKPPSYPRPMVKPKGVPLMSLIGKRI